MKVIGNISESLQTMFVSQRRRVLVTTHKMNNSSWLRRFKLKKILPYIWIVPDNGVDAVTTIE